MPTLKRQTADGTWSYVQTTGEDINALKTNTDTHIANTTNPHNVTAAQTGAHPKIVDANNGIWEFKVDANQNLYLEQVQ